MEKIPIAEGKIIERLEKSNNPISQPTVVLFKRLNELYGHLFLLDNHLNNHRKCIIDLVNNGKLDFSKLLAGSALVIRDLSEFPPDGWPRTYPTDSFSVRGEEYIQIIDDLICRYAAWTISSAYETFETFQKNIIFDFLNISDNYGKYERVFQDKLSEFKEKSNPFDRTLIEDWTKFVKYAYKNKFFRLIRTITPELKTVEKQNNQSIDLTVWYTVITEVRHAVTHFNRLIKNCRIRKWQPNHHALLANQINVVCDQHGYALNPTIKNARDILILFAEYGFAIFKCLSELENYDLGNILADSN